MTLFAKHAARPPGADRITDLTIREARAEDLPCLARIAAEREGGEPEDHRAGFERLLREVVPSGDGLVLVAVAGGEVAGFGKVARFRRETDSASQGSDDLAPEGWYLAGVVVDPSWRRRGIGDRLTAMRVEWIARRAAKAYYFVNARNTVSIDLHRRYGFAEITRRFTFPGASFMGGEGILFDVDLNSGFPQLAVQQVDLRSNPLAPEQVDEGSNDVRRNTYLPRDKYGTDVPR